MKAGDNGARVRGGRSDLTAHVRGYATHCRRNRKRRDLDACIPASGEPLKLGDDRQAVEHLITVSKANQGANFRTAHGVYKARGPILPTATTNPITPAKRRAADKSRLCTPPRPSETNSTQPRTSDRTDGPHVPRNAVLAQRCTRRSVHLWHSQIIERHIR